MLFCFACSGNTGLKTEYIIDKGFRGGIHAGIGIGPPLVPYQDFMLSWSAGFQYYLWRNLYVDLQICTSGTTLMDYGNGSHIYHPILGPGLLAGYDLYIWKNIGLNFDLGVGWDIKEDWGILPMMDIGIIFRIKL